MPSDIGTVIINARQVVPDMPQTSGPPTNVSAGATVVSGGALEPGTYYMVMTIYNKWGQTIPSNEFVVTVSPGQNAISVLFQAPLGNAGQFNLYVGTAPGQENGYWILNTGGADPFIMSQSLSAAIPGIPPTTGRAWLPDTDGELISAAAMYGWLNDGLRVISRIAGGLLDYSGVGSNPNVPLYVIPGEWIEITSVWYDGYWMMGGDRGYFWRRNNITSQILSSASISVVNNQNILEVYPQPARYASSTALTFPMATTDLFANVANTSGFLLPFGFMQINQEIMGYNTINGTTQFLNLIRGLGGTPAATHTIGATVTELNIFWSGKRQIEPSYAPGQSATLLPLPSGWDVLLAQYMSGRAKNIEHDGQYWQQLDQAMKQSIADWGKLTRGVMRRRQVGPPTSPATFYNTPAGGLIIQ